MDFMLEAIDMAHKAYKHNEVPIGAVIVKDNKIIAKAYNNREHTQQAINHAEILAIRKACRKLKSWRLNDCIMYVTLEPCPMCAGAILNSRIKKVYIACKDDNYGAVDSKYSILSDTNLNHRTEFEFGSHEQESKALLQKFFTNLRNRNKS